MSRAFVGVCASLFVTSAALTIVWCTSMSTMGGMAMPGGWTMSMVWMRMPGQTWLESTASFVAMWVVMMAAMMLPSHAPMLWGYREAVRWTGESRLGRLTLVASIGYFFVWALFGLIVFLAGVMLAAIEMKNPALARALPVTAGLIILIAGVVQFTPWKAHHLAQCRETMRSGQTVQPGAMMAWREGMRFGRQCSLSCANLTAILLVVGVMDVPTMALLTVAITAERLASAGARVAQLSGAVAIAAGLLLVTRVAALR